MKPGTKFFRLPKAVIRQAGLTLVELMVSIAISVTVLSGVVQVLVVSKSNFVTGTELAAMQENARFAVKYMSDRIRMAGFTGCSSTPPNFANNMNDSALLWYVSGVGLAGHEFDAGLGTFPAEFSGEAAEFSDAIILRYGEDTGLRVSGVHDTLGASLPVNQAHSFQPGQPFVITSPNCLQITMFQSSGPVNAANTATTIEHGTGLGVTVPGACETDLGGTFTCANPGSSDVYLFPSGSRILALRTEAYYVGVSESNPSVPALFRERMYVDDNADIVTMAEELVQGVEILQIYYGLDSTGNDIADIYVTADDPLLATDKIVTVRLVMRMRSVNPVYTEDFPFGLFQDIADTDGADRFMRQTVSTTIRVRNS